MRGKTVCFRTPCMTDSRAPAPADSRITPVGWLILGLLVTASILFFIDRQTLAILKSTLATEFGLTNADYSALLTAYMLPYTLGYLVSGQLIDRWGTRRCAVGFLFFMSLATVASPGGPLPPTTLSSLPMTNMAWLPSAG